MSIFKEILKEAVDENLEQEVKAAEEEIEEISEPTEPEEDMTGEDVEETDLVSSVRDLIDSILDAMEEEMVSDGETIEGSIDIGLELISKYADQIPQEALQSIFDEISTYYETEIIEDDSEEDEFFEEPIEEIPEEDEITVESILRKNK